MTFTYTLTSLESIYKIVYLKKWYINCYNSLIDIPSFLKKRNV